MKRIIYTLTVLLLWFGECGDVYAHNYHTRPCVVEAGIEINFSSELRMNGATGPEVICVIAHDLVLRLNVDFVISFILQPESGTRISKPGLSITSLFEVPLYRHLKLGAGLGGVWLMPTRQFGEIGTHEVEFVVGLALRWVVNSPYQAMRRRTVQSVAIPLWFGTLRELKGRDNGMNQDSVLGNFLVESGLQMSLDVF
jgi:hypothetical protein